MEMFLNLIYFTEPYFIEILTSLFWFFSMLIFSPTILQNYHEFSRFFLVANCIVSDTSIASFFYQYQQLLHNQGKFGYHPSVFTKTKVHFMRFFAQKHLLSQLLRSILCNYDFIFLRVQVQVISTFTFRHDIIWKKRSFLYLQNFRNDLMLYSIGNDTFLR